MSRRWIVPLGGLLLLGGLCGGCVWSAFERPRFYQRFEIGGGRTLTVWSIRRDFLHDFDPDPNPLMVYYRVDMGTRELVPKTFLDHDDEGDYRFRVASADEGQLACVYEVNRASEDPSLLLMYDAQSGESWPRTGRETGEVSDRWRERYGRLKAENPELPTPPCFSK